MIPITTEATLQPDGVTLRLAEKVSLPAGRVTLTIQPSDARSGPTMLETLERIHREQQQRGFQSLGEEELAAEIARLRAEPDYESRWKEVWLQTERPGSTGSP